MTEKHASPEPVTGKRAWLENRTHQEHEPDSEADILRELGHGLIPSNGNEPEVQD